MLKIFLTIFFSFSLLYYIPAISQRNMPSDRQATKETVALNNNLKKLLNKGFMFGHQDDLAYGVGWKYDASTSSAGRSDIKDVTGDYPGVYGWELGDLEIDKAVNLDSVPFKTMQQLIKQG